MSRLKLLSIALTALLLCGLGATVRADEPILGIQPVALSTTCPTHQWLNVFGYPSSSTCSQPAVADIASFGTGVATALGINVGTAGSPVVNGGALGTPSSGIATNLTGLPLAGISNFGTGVATALGSNIGSAGAPVTFNGALGTPSSGVATNLTGTAASLTAGAVPASGLTGATLAAGVTASSLTSTGTLTGGATGAGFTVAVGTSTVTGTLPAANGGAGTVNGLLKANGSGTVSLATSGTDYANITVVTTCTPTDLSGASLTFTVADCYFTEVGKQVTWVFNFTFPTTANGATAKISLPVQPKATAGRDQLCPVASNNNFAVVFNLDNAAADFGIAGFSTTGTLVTNAGVSTVNEYGQCTYMAL